MTKNIHRVERVARIVVGAVLVSIALWGQNSSPWFLLGALPLATGLVGWCPPYALLGINTASGKCCTPKDATLTS